MYTSTRYPIQIVKSEDAINIITEKEFTDNLIATGQWKPPYGNKRFWRNIIFFSNHFGTFNIASDDYIVNVSKDNQVKKAIDNLKNIDELRTEPLSSIVKRYRDVKIFNYSIDPMFQFMASKCRISPPNLLGISLCNDKIYNDCFDQDIFPNDKWIGKQRYNIYTHDDELFEYEAAINKFAAYLFNYLVKQDVISEDIQQKFISELASTEDKSGIEIALDILTKMESEQLKIWLECLNYIHEISNDDERRFVQNWQGDDEFFCRWQEKDIPLIINLLNMFKEDLFFKCNLVGSDTNGFYSSGEESKLSIFVSLYEALQTVDANGQDGAPNNIIILLDEIDAFFHPKLL